MIETLNRILDDYQGSAKLLLENTAGQGSELALRSKNWLKSGKQQTEKNISGFVLILVMALLRDLVGRVF